MHALHPGPTTLVGYFDPDRPPVLSIQSGDSVIASSIDGSWHASEQPPGADGTALKRWPHRKADDRGHALLGPIRVEGARPGQTLRIHIEEVQAGSWGWTASDGGRLPHYDIMNMGDLPMTHLGWRLQGDTATSHLGDSCPIRPFLGVIGMPPPEPGQHSTYPPRRWGGNIDCRDLGPGSSLDLPISVPGAMLHIGDGHAAQGHGEVSGVAIECPLSHIQIRVEVLDQELSWPRFRTSEGLRGTLAFGDTIEHAWPIALEEMLRWVSAETDRELGHVVALGSVFADLHITQVVNGTVGVHCIWREEAR